MRRDTLVSSLAELARDYVNLRGTQAQIKIALDNLKVEQEILNVTRVRMEKGLVTGLDVESAAAQVESVKAQVPQLQEQVLQGINAISLLLDEPPLGLSAELIGPRAIPPNPPRVPVGLPSELARRRPDIRMAEAQLHAATANIGVAIAEFYPTVSLNASPTLQALEPRDIFKGSSLQYMNIGPSVTLPIFQGGRLKGQPRLAGESQQEAAIAYHKAVLSACTTSSTRSRPTRPSSSVASGFGRRSSTPSRHWCWRVRATSRALPSSRRCSTTRAPCSPRSSSWRRARPTSRSTSSRSTRRSAVVGRKPIPTRGRSPRRF